MSFSYRESYGFTGLPVDVGNGYHLSGLPGVKNTYGSHFGDLAGLIDITDLSNWPTSIIINDAAITTRVQDAAARDYNIAWDLEPMFNLADPAFMSHPISPSNHVLIDKVLDAAKHIYQVCKAAAPSVQIAFYKYPMMKSYFTPVNYFIDSSNPTYSAAYNQWIEDINRMNKRWNGSQLVDNPFADYSDFFMPDLYCSWGDYDLLVTGNSVIFQRENIIKTRDLLAAGKPITPVIWMYYHDSDRYTGKPASDLAFAKQIQTMKTYANGVVLFGGFGVSFPVTDYLHPRGSATPSQWASITNGVFKCRMANVNFAVRNVNFTGVTTYSQVAQKIQDAVNNILITGSVEIVNADPPSGSNPGVSFGTFVLCPYSLGPVTITYDGTNFVCNSAGGTVAPIGYTSPPDDYTRKSIYLYTFPDAISGTDIASSSVYINNFTTFNGHYSERNPDEWNSGWGIGTDWYSVWQSVTKNEQNTPTNFEATLKQDGSGVVLAWRSGNVV